MRSPEYQILYNGAPTWEVWVHYRFDSSPVNNLIVTAVSGFTRSSVPVTINPPVGARPVTMWFENWDHGYCCRRWDSNRNANYRFTLQP